MNAKGVAAIAVTGLLTLLAFSMEQTSSIQDDDCSIPNLTPQNPLFRSHGTKAQDEFFESTTPYAVGGD
jgi:hypothetical protein